MSARSVFDAWGKRALLGLALALFPLHGLAESWRDDSTPWQDPLQTLPVALRLSPTLSLAPELQQRAAVLAWPAPLASGVSPRAVVEAGVGPCLPREGDTPSHRQQALALLQAAQSKLLPEPEFDADERPWLTLATAIELTLCHSPQVRTSANAIAQQAAQLGLARSAYWPRLQFGATRQRSEMGADSVWVNRQHAVLSWRLWDFGSRSARTDAAQAQLQAALLMQDASVREALADMLQSYGQVQVAQAKLKTQLSLRPLAERNLQAVRRREQGGAASANEALQARAALARIELEISRSQGELETVQARLSHLLGLPPGTAYRVQAEREVEMAVSSSQEDAESLWSRSLDDWLDQALQQHPAIQAARAQWQSAQAQLQAVQAEGLPTVDINVGHYRHGRPDTAVAAGSLGRENLIGLSLNFPLFEGFAHTYKVRSAQAELAQKVIDLEATELQTLQDLVVLHAQAKAAFSHLQVARRLFVVSQELAQSAQRQYERGAMDVMQLNQGLSHLQQAQGDLSRSYHDWHQARLRLWLQELAVE